MILYICRLVKRGGLGIKNLGAYNKFILKKWVWKFFGKGDRLWSKVIRSMFSDLK